MALLERFEAKIELEPTSGCWLWTAQLDRDGYGQFRFEGRKWAAHRLAYTALVGPIPEGLTIDHLCRVPGCVNPDHMEPVTIGENTRRGTTGQKTGAMQRAKTHCPQGHEYNAPNTYVYGEGKKRGCRTCRAASQRLYKARKNNG